MLTHLQPQNPLQGTEIYFTVTGKEATAQKKIKHSVQHRTVPVSKAGRQLRSQFSALCLDHQDLLSPTQLGTNCKGDTASSKPRCHKTQHANTMCIDKEPW